MEVTLLSPPASPASHSQSAETGNESADRPSICPSLGSSKEGTRCFTFKEVVHQPRIVLQRRRASPTNRNLNLRSRCRGIEPRAPRARQLPADTRRFRRRRRNLDFDFCGERQPRQPRSPHSLSSSPLCHSRVFVTSFVTSTFHCRNVAPPFAERGARRNNLPLCPTGGGLGVSPNVELPAIEAKRPPRPRGAPGGKLQAATVSTI